jgi:hypothetical protein
MPSEMYASLLSSKRHSTTRLFINQGTKKKIQGRGLTDDFKELVETQCSPSIEPLY